MLGGGYSAVLLGVLYGTFERQPFLLAVIHCTYVSTYSADKNLKMFSVDLKETIAQSSLSDLVGDVWGSLRLGWVGHAGGERHKWYCPFTCTFSVAFVVFSSFT